MRKLSLCTKAKKGFTLIELIAVMAIMAIATAMVLPNIRGMISKTEESKYRNYCVEATSYVRGYANLLTMGEEYISYEKDGKLVDQSGNPYRYTITSNSGLTGALNEYNLESDYQYYVLAYEDTSATSNPTTSIQTLISKNKIQKKDVMITVITKSQGSSDRVPKYTLRGFWYFSYEQNSIVYFYYSASKRCGVGFSKLTSDGK